MFSSKKNNIIFYLNVTNINLSNTLKYFANQIIYWQMKTFPKLMIFKRLSVEYIYFVFTTQRKSQCRKIIASLAVRGVTGGVIIR